MIAIVKKPALRGVSHLIGFFVAAVAGAILVASGPFWSSLVYCLSLIAMFGISAFYHVPNWSPRIRTWLRRADHAAIFLLIAGTCTPIALLALSPESSRSLLWAIWIAAAAGVLQSFFWVKAPKILTACFYLAVGWLCSPYIPEIFSMISGRAISLLLLGGITYSVGAVVYALKRPNPFPSVFGYHEVFHALVVVASLLHFLAICDLVGA
jgi:hemolysin III